MARSKTLTKPQIARGKKLATARDAASMAVFGGLHDVPWNQCYRTAPDSVRTAYDDAGIRI